MNPSPSKKPPYLLVNLWIQNIKRTKRIHVLVLESFRGPCPLGLEGCHNDGNHLNNNLSNLRWDTRASNMRDNQIHGKTSKGEHRPLAKLTEADVKQIRKLAKEGMAQAQIARMYNVSKSTIHDTVHYRQWKHIP